MVAHSKHRKLSSRKENHNNHHPRKAHPARLHATSQLPLERPPVKEEEFPKEDEEPKPEDLAKEEEALKAAELEEAAAAAATEVDADGSAEHRGRERSSYDGDTAIKLYL